MLFLFPFPFPSWTGIAEDENLGGNSADPSEVFKEFAGRLEELQEKEEFYDLWSILRGSSGTPFTEDRYREFKDIEIFEPTEEAALRYYCDGELTDLSKAYSDLWEGEKRSVEELSRAVEKGEYDL